MTSRINPPTTAPPPGVVPRPLAPGTTLRARALLLDMDGTLVDSDAVVERCWRRWAARHGLDGGYAYAVSHGRQARVTMAELLPDRPDAVNLAEARQLVEEEKRDVDGVVPVPGAPDFLAALSMTPHALVTSADLALARVRMTAAGLPLPAVLVTADRVAASKPHPEGFLTAAAELGVAPGDCVVFEDSPAGIAAGRAAGMRVVGVGARALREPATVHAPDLRAVAVETGPDGEVLIRVRTDMRA